MQRPQMRDAHLRPAIWHARQVGWFASITSGCITYFFVVVVILHVLRPETSPVSQAVSNYALGPYGFLMTSAFFVLALGILALALGIPGGIEFTRRALVSVLLLYTASAAMVVMGIFHGDVNVPHPPATVTGLIHWVAASISFMGLMIAAFLLSFCFKEDERWQSFYKPALVLALAATIALVVYGALALFGWVGIGERIYIAVSLLWPLLTAVWLRKVISGKILDMRHQEALELDPLI